MRSFGADIQTGITNAYPSTGAPVAVESYMDDAGNFITIFSDGSYSSLPPTQGGASLSTAGGILSALNPLPGSPPPPSTPPTGGLSGTAIVMLALLGIIIVPNLFAK